MKKNRPYLIFKRIFDICFAIILLIATSPILIICAILIKLESKGPVFYLQKRLGKDGVVFDIYKFRTMVDGAANIGTGLFTHNKDPRITKMGNFLRKTSFDELPQIINILRGQMSFIGPRPPVPYFPRKWEEYSDEDKIRFRVLPGISGLAQILVRTTATWDERIKIDILYVKTISAKLDLEIFFKTILSILFSKNIYPTEEEIKRRIENVSK